jgi:hypothetical protein
VLTDHVRASSSGEPSCLTPNPAWSTTVSVLGVATIAAVASYVHAYDLVRAHGETGWTARMVPLTVDGLIYARLSAPPLPRGQRLPWSARTSSS